MSMSKYNIQHYENFPVASWLCPAQLRPAVCAIYHYARTADDIADEGAASAGDRLIQLTRYRQALMQTIEHNLSNVPHQWQWIFQPLHQAIAQHQIPPAPVLQLLDAFEQDIYNPPYATRSELLQYCERSANPVGRLILHLYGIHDPALLKQSDAICSALQLINFWQDLQIDLGRNRCYIPQSDLDRFELKQEQLQAGQQQLRLAALLEELAAWARTLMNEGASLATKLPGRMGWELRLVVQGGLRILEKIHRNQYQCLMHRPQIHPWDAPVLAWRALFMY
jgi:squalene synthase HpnC